MKVLYFFYVIPKISSQLVLPRFGETFLYDMHPCVRAILNLFINLNYNICNTYIISISENTHLWIIHIFIVILYNINPSSLSFRRWTAERWRRVLPPLLCREFWSGSRRQHAIPVCFRWLRSYWRRRWKFEGCQFCCYTLYCCWRDYPKRQCREKQFNWTGCKFSSYRFNIILVWLKYMR